MGSDVVVYSTRGCQGCRLTAKALTAAGVDFEVVYLEECPQVAQLVRAMGHTSAPVVFTGRAWRSGFRPDLIHQLDQPGRRCDPA